MSAKRWALSLFFVWHVVAMSLGALASPGAVVPVGPPRHPENNAIAAALTPAFDVVAALVAPVPTALLRASGPLQGLATSYLEITGIAQSWKMFSNPPEVDQYVRVRYYIGPNGTVQETAAAPTWTATELVLPAHREDHVRLVRGYWAASRDKALTSALQRFHRDRDDGLLRPDTTSAELPDDLAPIARYFARRFHDKALRPDERILRTEVWYGTAPMPLPGATSDRTRSDARLTALRDYYEGPIEDHFGRPVYPPYSIAEDEADIRWFMEYFEP